MHDDNRLMDGLVQVGWVGAPWGAAPYGIAHRMAMHHIEPLRFAAPTNEVVRMLEWMIVGIIIGFPVIVLVILPAVLDWLGRW